MPIVVDVEASDVSGETPVRHTLDLGLEEVVIVGDLEEVMDPGGEDRGAVLLVSTAQAKSSLANIPCPSPAVPWI